MSLGTMNMGYFNGIELHHCSKWLPDELQYFELWRDDDVSRFLDHVEIVELYPRESEEAKCFNFRDVRFI